MFHRVLVPTDFSEWSDAALRLLPALKPLGSPDVLLVHVVDARSFSLVPDFLARHAAGLEARAQQELEARRARVMSLGLHAETLRMQGAPVEAILRAAGEQQADLILMGSRRRSFLQQAVLGSVSENVIRHAPIPLLLGKGPAPEGQTVDVLPFGNLLFPTDFSPCAEKAFRTLRGLVPAGVRRVTLMHVQDVRVFGDAAPDADATMPRASIGHLEQVVDGNRLSQCRAELEALGVEVRLLVREGVPHREILRAAEEEGATAIVLGSHGKSSLAEILLGSVSAEVLRQARVPVLVVRRDFEEEPSA